MATKNNNSQNNVEIRLLYILSIYGTCTLSGRRVYNDSLLYILSTYDILSGRCLYNDSLLYILFIYGTLSGRRVNNDSLYLC